MSFNIYNNFRFFLKSAMDRIFVNMPEKSEQAPTRKSPDSGQAIMEFVVFTAMFAFAIIAFYNQGIIKRMVQGKMRSAASSISPEQYRIDGGSTTPPISIDNFVEPVSEDVIVSGGSPGGYPDTADIFDL